jgi:hypothetical protein
MTTTKVLGAYDITSNAIIQMARKKKQQPKESAEDEEKARSQLVAENNRKIDEAQLCR